MVKCAFCQKEWTSKDHITEWMHGEFGHICPTCASPAQKMIMIVTDKILSYLKELQAYDAVAMHEQKLKTIAVGKINTQRHHDGFMAWMGDDKSKWEYGKSRAEAIGKLIISHFPDIHGNFYTERAAVKRG